MLRDRNMKVSQSVIPFIYELSLAKSYGMNGCEIFSLFFYFLGLTNSSSSRFQFSSLYLTSSTGLLLYSRESPQDCLQRELQVRGPGEVSSQPGSHHAAAGRGVLEVTHIFNRFFPLI